MDKTKTSVYDLAERITKDASRQTYFTVRFLVDRELVKEAYLAYGYFRWLDDMLDSTLGEGVEKCAFVERQRAIAAALYQGQEIGGLRPEEQMLAVLIASDTGKDHGLESYIHNMMGVMEFDARRRGRSISEAELSEYTRMLAVAVTDALYYFIGHADSEPDREGRYLAVTAAHITHMLRDMLDDIQNGYLNMPREVLDQHETEAFDALLPCSRQWVCSRVDLARRFFSAGRVSIRQSKNWRRRLAGFAYTARFEWVLTAIERDSHCLRSEYSQRKSIAASMWMGWRTFLSFLGSLKIFPKLFDLGSFPMGVKEL